MKFEFFTLDFKDGRWPRRYLLAMQRHLFKDNFRVTVSVQNHTTLFLIVNQLEIV